MKRNVANVRLKTKNDRLICPHCRSGNDGRTLGLFWEFGECCWRCVICGYRSFVDFVPARTA
jgi:hypothetical protein